MKNYWIEHRNDKGRMRIEDKHEYRWVLDTWDVRYATLNATEAGDEDADVTYLLDDLADLTTNDLYRILKSIIDCDNPLTLCVFMVELEGELHRRGIDPFV